MEASPVVASVLCCWKLWKIEFFFEKLQNDGVVHARAEVTHLRGWFCVVQQSFQCLVYSV